MRRGSKRAILRFRVERSVKRQDLDLGRHTRRELRHRATNLAGSWQKAEHVPIRRAAHLVYGVPGDPELRLRAPFDHFDVDAGLSTTDTPQPTTPMPLTIVVWESVPTQVSG